MIKKAMMATAGAAMLAGVMFGTESVSYFTTSANWLRDSVKQSVPLEFEIERARNMVKDLSSDIEQSMHTIAKEEVEVEKLTKQIQQLQETQTGERLGLTRLQNELSSNKQSFEFGGKVFTVSQVKADLSNRFERFKTNDATLASLAEIQQARQKSLEAARQKLEGMLASKRKLEVDVQNCEARLNMLAAAQTTSEVSLDDSRLSRARSLISDVQTRLSVATKQLEATSRLQSDIPLDKTSDENVVDQVTEYLRSQQPASAAVAQQ
jgi:chromosome segregation ATPase